MGGYFLLHVFVIPVAIFEMLMGWNRGIMNPRHKLRIGNTGNAGPGNPAINALFGVIEGVVGTNSIGEVKRDLIQRNATAELVPPSTDKWGEMNFTRDHLMEISRMSGHRMP